MRSGEIIRPENCSKVWVKTRWLRSRVRVTGSSTTPSSAAAMVRWEMPWVAASRLKSASHALKSPPQGAARDGPQIAMEISASAIDGNQVRMECKNGPAIGDPQDVCRGPLGVTFHLRLSFIRCRP